MSVATIRKVNELKESLAKEIGKEETERCKDILHQLDAITDMSLKVLSETLIGTVVSKLKSHSDNQISTQAKGLVKKWKKIAKESGIGSASFKSSSPPTEQQQQQQQDTKPGAATSTAAAVAAAPNKSTTATSSLSTSSNHSTTDPPEWEHLPPLRKNTIQKLHETFSLSTNSLVQESEIDMDTVQSLIQTRVTQVELACHEYSKGIKQSYIDKIRSLIFNLKKNGNLRENVILNTTCAETLVQLEPEQLATSEKSKEISERLAKLKDSRRLDWEQANEGKINEMCGIKGDLLKASLFTCGRCKSIKTTSTQKQTRSADEPMTVFVLCLNCGNRWKC